jgi:CubicO group peptidase (beta-lactamase class C family)
MKARLLPVLILVTLSPLAHSAETPGALAPVLQSFVDQHIAPGVVALVANQDGVLDVERAGWASLATRTPMRDDSVFWIASMSKSLTATALMMQQQQRHQHRGPHH